MSDTILNKCHAAEAGDQLWEATMDGLRRHLLSPSASVLLLAGPAGVGKTSVVRSMIDELNAAGRTESGKTQGELRLVEINGEMAASWISPPFQPSRGFLTATQLLRPLTSRVRQGTPVEAEIPVSRTSGWLPKIIHQGGQPVILVDNLELSSRGVSLMEKLRQVLPPQTIFVATTRDLKASPLEHPDVSVRSWKVLPCLPSLSDWERYHRTQMPFSPHTDLTCMAVSYLQNHPADAWYNHLPETRINGSCQQWGPYVPSPRDWTLSVQEHALMLRLTARHGDEGEWQEYLSEIYGHYLSGPIGHRFVDFFARQPLPTAREVLIEGTPPRLGWRHPQTLPEFAAEMGKTFLEDIAEVSSMAEPNPEVTFRLSCFAAFLDDLESYGWHLSRATTNGLSQPPSEPPRLFSVNNSRPAPDSVPALISETFSALRGHLSSIQEKLRDLTAAGYNIPEPISRFVQATAVETTCPDMVSNIRHGMGHEAGAVYPPPEFPFRLGPCR